MRIAIVGSRDYPNPQQVIDYVNTLPLDTAIVSGGARGVDSVAEQAARKRGMTVQVFPADWDTHGKAAGMIRNQLIVDYADSVVAFTFQNSKGTANTIERAIRAGKPVTVIDAQDSEVSDNHGLLTCEQFRAARDEMALDRMLKRGAELWEQADAKLLEARALRKRLQAARKHERHAIEEAYTKAITALGEMDAELGAILRDQRYIDWKAKQPIAETA